MKNTLIKLVSLLLILLLVAVSSANAHSGRTDSKGGHKDNKNKSGLGSYHYHCGGHPAHLHSGGICPYAPKDKISVSNMPSKMYVGDMVNLSWKVTANSGSNNVTWTSSNANVLQISSSGIISAIAPGKATITATMRNGEKSYNITISNRAVTDITLSVPSTEVTVGSVIQIKAAVLPDNATDKSLSWTSTKEDVAIVTQDGTAIIIGSGNVTLTAETQDGSKKKKSVKLTSTDDPNSIIDASYIMKQLPKDYIFAVKPGSSAANFVQTYNLPYRWAEVIYNEGSSGNDIVAMKKRLQELGYFTAGASLSDQYNSTTTERVKLFQKTNGLPQTGIANTETLLLLFSDRAKSKP